MNARQWKYAVVLSKTRNFSQTADQLGVSQPTLSKQIIALETELGLKLFDRTKNPLELTPAGEFFVAKAQEMLYAEEQLQKTLEQFKAEENGQLVIGVTPFRSMTMMPSLVTKIKARYPGVKVILHEVNAMQLHKDAVEGICDFSILNLPVDDPLLETVPLGPDTLVLAVPNPLVPRLENVPAAPSAPIDLKQAKDLPFITLRQGQEMRQLLDRLCISNGFYPNIAVEVTGITTAWAMASAGIGAVLLPLQFVQMQNFDSNLTLFSLARTAYTRQPAIVTRRGQYVSRYAAFAMDLLKNG
jgi:DNA-binding transcriptional LysR family regulator